MKLLYFAWVRQKIGKSEEELDLPAGVGTIAELTAWLRLRGQDYADALADPARFRAARNQEHAPFDTPLADADEVAFFPPVTGG
ncbi:MAG: molybdopterin converting factor subunit 1 [Rhizomicrobium sp.]